MGKQTLEARVGEETHSSRWGKGYLRGVKLVADERQKANNYDYTTGAAEVEDGTVFSWWMSRGSRRDTVGAEFFILEADSSADLIEMEGGCYNKGENYLRVRAKILARGSGKLKSARLLTWWASWAKENGGQTAQMARHLGAQLEIPGRSTPDPMPAPVGQEGAGK